MLIAAVGGPAVLPQATLREQGFKGTIYQTHAVATDDFIKLGKDKVEGTVLAAGPMLVIDEIADSNPTKKVALAYIAAYEKQFGTKPATFGANTWDAGLLLERAIPDGAEDGEARHRSVSLGVARCAGAGARGRRLPGRVQHVADESQRHGRARARAGHGSRRQVPVAAPSSAMRMRPRGR